MQEFSFHCPTEIVFGRGVEERTAELLRKYGAHRVFIVYGGGSVIKSGLLARVERVITAAGLAFSVRGGVRPNPRLSFAREAVREAIDFEADFLLAVGGGSVIDTAKAIAFLSVSKGKLRDYMHVDIDMEVPYLVAIPTTAGTGSEVTKNTIIADTENNVKMLLGGPSIIPALAVVDPTFTMTAPPKVTAATGIDALCHAIEAYTSRKAQPLTDTFALSAIKKIHKNLPLCYADGKNVEARLAMSIAATEAGIAFNNASVTIVHGMSRPIGALFHIAHGVSNAILLPACMKFAIEENTERFATIARVMGVADDLTPAHDAAKAFVKEVARFCKAVGIPTIEELGVKKDDFFAQLSKMADDALESGSPQNTMRVPTKDQLIAIYKELY